MRAPDPQTQRAALQGDPEAIDQIKPDQNAEATAERQVRSLRRAYRFCHATACTVATLAYGVVR